MCIRDSFKSLLIPPPAPRTWNSFLYYDINGTGIILILEEDVLNGKSVLRDEYDFLTRILWMSQFYQFNTCHSNKPLVSSVLKALIINFCSLGRRWNKNNSLLRLTLLFFAVPEQILLDIYIVHKLLRLAQPRCQAFFVISSQFHYCHGHLQGIVDSRICARAPQTPSNVVQVPWCFSSKSVENDLWPINKLIHKQC